MAMVKLIVLDVDGVIVGSKKGENFPYPSEKVILALKKIRESGIPIILCSGKYHTAIDPIILKANLNNPHITDSGGLIINPITGTTEAFEIEKGIVKEVLSECIAKHIRIEAFSERNFFIQKNQIDEFTKKRHHILQEEPTIADSIPEAVTNEKIIKIIALAKDDKEKKVAEDFIQPFAKRINFVWTIHPATGTVNYCLITSKTTSKILALRKVNKSLGISLDDALGVGDTLGDWEFMRECGYTATMGDATEKLKRLCDFTAPSVD